MNLALSRMFLLVKENLSLWGHVELSFMINNTSEIERMDVKENPSQTPSVLFFRNQQNIP